MQQQDRPDFGPKGRAEAIKRFGQPADHDEPTEPTEPTERGAAGAAEAIRRHPTQQKRATQ